ncbi:MAG: type II 3-dehydroquinate dehydratase [Erysipelotrichales bacterium]|nr:type II 3-dehydroquinate dehydratase [Erysipelotrichales bacterium]
MKFMVINGPNLNMVGIREPSVYGKKTYEELLEMIREEAARQNDEVTLLQSNHEGDLVDWIQRAYFDGYDGIVINPGGYTHTSVAIADAVKAIAPLPVVEVHISDVEKREEFRKISYLRPYCLATVAGCGFDGYLMAMRRIREHSGA